MEKTLNTLKDLEAAGFVGSVDVDLAISLFEYGLAHKVEKDGSTLFIYGVGMNLDEDEYSTFDTCHYTESDFSDLVEAGGWFDLPAVLSCCGMSEKEWLNLDLPSKIHDCIMYYGSENIFGSSYPWTINKVSA